MISHLRFHTFDISHFVVNNLRNVRNIYSYDGYTFISFMGTLI